MSAEAPPPSGGNRGAIAIAAGVIVLVAVILAVVLTRPEVGDVAEPEATPAPRSEAPESSPPADPTTPATEAAQPTDPATTAPAETQPTDAQIEAFAAAEEPADHTATGDINGDGLTDVVVATRRDETTRIRVGFWDGAAFTEHSDEGGPAAEITALDVADYNGEPGAEIVTTQSVGEAGRSISVWGGEGDRLVRLSGEGGCWDGFHTYGISGATIELGRITATCDGSPLPPEAWSRDVYEWDGGWRYTESITPED